MATNEEIIVKVTPGGLQASMTAPAGLSTEMFTPETLELLAKQADIPITQQVAQKLKEFVQAYGDGSKDITFVFAEAVTPVHGDDGRIEWFEDYDPSGKKASADDNDKGTDHYAARMSTMVKAGTIVGIAHPPTPGEDGRNVSGHVINAKPGRPYPVKFDESLIIDADHQIIAQLDGIILVRDGVAMVSEHLDIPGDVDFSTGRIDFQGSVNIGGSVKPGFSIKTTGNLDVHKLIEGTEIECEANFTAAGGIVGQGRGTLDVKGDVTVSHIADVKGVIGGALKVEREIIDCTLDIGGDLSISNGSIIGGELTVTGSLFAKTLGSGAWVATTILLGDVPVLRIAQQNLAKKVLKLESQVNRLVEQESMFEMSPRLTHQEKERITELEFEISEARNEVAAAKKELRRIDEEIESRKRVDVHIGRTVHPQVVLRIGDTNVTFKDSVTGPIWIGRNESLQLCYRKGNGEMKPITEIAHISQGAPPEQQQQASEAA